VKTSLLLLVLGACAAPVQPAPAHYPSLPKSVDAALAAPSFAPSALLTALPVVCGPSERGVANGLDDDCNGSIDDGLFGPGSPSEADAQDAALVLSLSYPQTDELTLGLRRDDKTLVDITPTDCTPERAFCTRRLPTRDLPRGHHTLVALPSDARAAAAPAPSLVVSTQSHGNITTYVAAVATGRGEQVLGQLDLSPLAGPTARFDP
jgi:hypothetical protein